MRYTTCRPKDRFQYEIRKICSECHDFVMTHWKLTSGIRRTPAVSRHIIGARKLMCTRTEILLGNKGEAIDILLMFNLGLRTSRKGQE